MMQQQQFFGGIGGGGGTSLGLGQESFTEDSPRFAKSVHDFNVDSAKLMDYFKFLVKSMKSFCKSVKQCSEAGQALSHAIGSNSLLHSIGVSQNILPILSLFGNVFAEFAGSQEILAESLEQAFVQPLELFASQSINKFITQQSGYEREKSTMEECLIRYLQQDNSIALTGLMAKKDARYTAASQEHRAMELVTSRKRLEICRFDLVRLANQIENEKGFELADSCISAMVALRTHHHVGEDRLHSLTSVIEDYSRRQSSQKEKYSASRKTLDSDRCAVEDILKNLVERAESQLPVINVVETPVDATSAAMQNSNSNSGSTSGTSGTSANSGNNNTSYISSNASGGNPSSNSRSNSGGFGFENMMSSISKPGFLTSFTKSIDLVSASVSSTRNRTSSLDNGSRSPQNGTDQPGLSTSAAAGEVLPSMTFDEVEKKMKPLDKSDIKTLFRSPAGLSASQPKIVKQGYVLERQSGKLMQMSWVRRWIVLDQEKLYFLHETSGNRLMNMTGLSIPETSLETQIICDLMLCNAKEKKGVTELPYLFEVAHANLKTFTFQAEGAQEYESWMDSIRATIEHRLSGYTSTPSTPSSSNNNNSANYIIATGKEDALVRELRTAALDTIYGNNGLCADCGRANPDWIALNLGTVICIECSGIHRSLGVQISKVRSLKLDTLLLQEYKLVQVMGNSLNRQIWEATYISETPDDQRSSAALSSEVDDDKTIGSSNTVSNSYSYSKIPRPKPSDGYAVRDNFIRAKYQRGMFQNDLNHVVSISFEGSMQFASKSNLEVLLQELSNFESPSSGDVHNNPSTKRLNNYVSTRLNANDNNNANAGVIAANDGKDKVILFQYPNLVLYLKEVCKKNDVSLLANLLAHDVLRPCSTHYSFIDSQDFYVDSDIVSSSSTSNSTSNSNSSSGAGRFESIVHPILVCAANGSIDCLTLLVLFGQELAMFDRVQLKISSTGNTANDAYVNALFSDLVRSEDCGGGGGGVDKSHDENTAAVSSSQTVNQSPELLVGETDLEYITRQRKIQDEARERMRRKFGSSSGLSSGSSKMEGIGSHSLLAAKSDGCSNSLTISSSTKGVSSKSYIESNNSLSSSNSNSSATSTTANFFENSDISDHTSDNDDYKNGSNKIENNDTYLEETNDKTKVLIEGTTTGSGSSGSLRSISLPYKSLLRLAAKLAALSNHANVVDYLNMKIDSV